MRNGQGVVGVGARAQTGGAARATDYCFFFFFPEHATDYSEFVGVKFWGRSPLTLLGQHFHSCRVSYFQLTGNGPGGEEFEPIDVKAHL